MSKRTSEHIEHIKDQKPITQSGEWQYNMLRRDFLKIATGIVTTAILVDRLSPRSAEAFVEDIPYDPKLDAYRGFGYGIIKRYSIKEYDPSKFTFLRLKYSGGDWHTNAVDYAVWPSEVKLCEILAKTTSTPVQLYNDARFITLDDPNLFAYPFLYMTGHIGFSLSELEVKRLREYIERGGFLMADDCDIRIGQMRESIHRELKRVFPSRRLEKLELSHPVYHTIFNHDEYLGGDKLAAPYNYDEGLILNDRLVVYLCPNDLGCAWQGRPCTPAGETQRRWAFEQGINVIMYAMTH